LLCPLFLRMNLLRQPRRHQLHLNQQFHQYMFHHHRRRRKLRLSLKCLMPYLRRHFLHSLLFRLRLQQMLHHHHRRRCR
jgi:hypothetical protein